MSKRFFILVAMVAVIAWAAGNASANVLSNENLGSNHFAGLSCGPDGTLNDSDDIVFEFDWQWPAPADSGTLYGNRSGTYVAFRAATGRSYDRGGGSTYGGTPSLYFGMGTNGVRDLHDGTLGYNNIGFYIRNNSFNFDSGFGRTLIGTAETSNTAVTEVWHHMVAKYMNTDANGGFASATYDGALLGEAQIDYVALGVPPLHGTGFKGFGLVSRMVEATDHNRRYDNFRINGGINGVEDDLDSDPVGAIAPGTPYWVIDNDSRPYGIIGGMNLPNIYGGSAYANIPTTTNAANLLSTGTAMASLDEIVSMDFKYPTTCTAAIATGNAVTASLLARADGINGLYGAGDGATTHGKAVQLRVSVVDAGGGNYRFHYDIIALDTNNAAGTVLGSVDGGVFDHAWHRLRGVFAGGGVGVREGERDVIVVNGISPSINGLEVGIASSYTGLAEPTAAVLIDNVTVGGTNLDTGFQFESGGVVVDTEGAFTDGPTTGPNAVYASNPASWALSPDTSDVSLAVTAVHGWEMY